MLVEQGAAPAERDTEGGVLVAMPADRRLHDQSALRDEVERPQLAREEQRVPQGSDHRAGREAKRVVTAAMAESRTSELGQGIAGSWLPGMA